MVTAGSGESSERSRRRRRRWSENEKRQMVAECEAPGSSVSIVARRLDVNANQLFTWRRQFRDPAVAEDDHATFVPAVIAPQEAIVDGETPLPQSEKAGAESRPARGGTGRMEIVLAGGYRVIVDRDVSTRALIRVLDALAGR